jgi:dihydroneopterin aldolase
MKFYGYHGVFPEETKLGQRFMIDLKVELDLSKAGKSDDLSQSHVGRDGFRAGAPEDDSDAA